MKRVESYELVRRRQRFFWRLVALAFFIFFVAEIGGTYILKSYQVVSESMSPGLQAGSRFLLAPSAYSFTLPFNRNIRRYHSQPARGDIVLLDTPSTPARSWLASAGNRLVRFFTLQQRGLGQAEHLLNRPVLKRVVAVPGDTVRMENFIIYVKTPDSRHFLTEHEVASRVYDTLRQGSPANWADHLPFSGSMDELVLGENQFFVINDNRLHSNDSRFFGLVDLERIRGKAVIKYWPFSRPLML